MEQFLQLMCNSDYVSAVEAFDYDFYDYNKFLDVLYKDLNKPGVKKWQIFSVDKVQEGQQLSMNFKTSNRDDAPRLTFPIIQATTNRHAKLTTPLTKLVPPGIKDIKQVELHTKFRKFVPTIDQEECFPKPKDDI